MMRTARVDSHWEHMRDAVYDIASFFGISSFVPIDNVI